jgi:Adenylate and Guanylate cyclase catalytic domain
VSTGDPFATPDEWFGAVRDAERRGELLDAVDLAERGLALHPDDLRLRHRAVLALARAGATGEAARRFSAYGLDAVDDGEVAALGARIAKDAALALEGAARARAAAHAARLYAEIHERTADWYPAINTATLWMVAGETDRARTLAAQVLSTLAASGDASYFAAATEGEAQLLVGDVAAATDALTRAAGRHDGDYGALATTRRQLRLICGLRGIDEAVLEPLAGPAVAHYCGHMIDPEIANGRFPASAERAVADAMRHVLASEPVGFAYGALAAGADLLWAEALLETGVELHVVLPFEREEFVATSVAPAGEAWVPRFWRCLTGAASVTYGTENAFRGDDGLLRYGSELAMGLAVLRARHLDADVRQLALWDGAPARRRAGTAIDVARWRSTGRLATVIAPPHPAGRAPAEAVAASGDRGRDEARVVRALLFGDIRGFSKLSDEQLPRFADHVLGSFARVLDHHAGEVEHRNSWGDAIYVVARGVERAAACALELQDAMGRIDLDAAGLPGHLALRLGAHVGPVFPVRDAVLGAPAFMGSHVSRTARVEPVTPPGEVYVTEAFAALHALAGQTETACDYVGHLPAAKDFGRLRMYRLRRADAVVPQGGPGR